MVRKSAVDIGNARVKALFGEEMSELDIPNVIAPHSDEREIIQGEAAKEALHVRILSGALNGGRGGNGTYVVGSLAARQHQNDELAYEDSKADHDQPVIMLLTALAFDAVSKQSGFKTAGDVTEATYFLSTGLPLGESKKKGTRKAFKEKLKGNSHEVTFLSTPGLEGKKVTIKFSDVIVNVEGHAAMIDLTTNKDGSPRNEELTNMTVLIHDIGGLSTDDAIINPDGSVDNLNSDGEKEGLSIYLDEMIRRVDADFGVKKYFKSRQDLISVLIHKDAKYRNHVIVKSNRESIQYIVDEVFGRAARAQYGILKRLWSKVPSIEVAYLIGGGSVMLQKYIEEINQSENKYDIRFVADAEESIWMIVRAYYKLMNFYLAEAAAAASE